MDEMCEFEFGSADIDTIGQDAEQNEGPQNSQISDLFDEFIKVFFV